MFAGATKCGRVLVFEAKGEKQPNDMKKLSDWEVHFTNETIFFSY